MVGERKWGILAAFCFTSSMNALMMMDFAASTDISESTLGVDESQIDWLYSATLYVGEGLPLHPSLVSSPLARRARRRPARLPRS